MLLGRDTLDDLTLDLRSCMHTLRMSLYPFSKTEVAFHEPWNAYKEYAVQAGVTFAFARGPAC